MKMTDEQTLAQKADGFDIEDEALDLLDDEELLVDMNDDLEELLLFDNGEDEEAFQMLSSGETVPYDLSNIATTDFLGLYMEENSGQTLLTADEEVELAMAMEAGKEANRLLEKDDDLSTAEQERLWLIKENGDAARTRLIRANTRLVISFAKKYRGQGLDFLDLIQEGNIGLLTAVDKYDYRLGNRFSTYATWWIRQGVTRALANHSREIRIPAHLNTSIRRLYRVRQELEQESGQPPTPEEIAAHAEMSLSRVRWLLQITRPLLHFEQPAGEDADTELGDFIEDVDVTSPPEAVAQKLLNEQIIDILDQLTPREAHILRLRYGLLGHRPHTLKEVGKKLHLSRERIRQLEKMALRKLRQPDFVGHLHHYLN